MEQIVGDQPRNAAPSWGPKSAKSDIAQ